MFVLLTVMFNFSLLGFSLLVAFLGGYWLSSNVRIWAKALVIVVAAGALQLGTSERASENARLRATNIRVNPSSDNSYNSRFVDTWRFVESLPATEQICGIGLGNFGEFMSYGSTYGFLIVYLGLAGMTIFLGMGIAYLRGLCGAGVMALGFIAVLLAGTLMPTYMMFWLMVASVAILESGAAAGTDRRRSARLVRFHPKT